MPYRGHVKKGGVVFDEAVDLPEGTLVIVEAPPQLKEEKQHPDIARFRGILPQNLDARKDYHLGKIEKHRGISHPHQSPR
jgi:hypothetical protein